MLAVAYEKTQELARDLRVVGCGDLDVEGNEINFRHCWQPCYFFVTNRISYAILEAINGSDHYVWEYIMFTQL